MVKKTKLKKFWKKTKKAASTGFAKGGQAVRAAGKNIYQSYMTEEGQTKRIESQIAATERQTRLAEAQAKLARAQGRTRRPASGGGVPGLGDFGMKIGDPFEAMGMGRRKKKKNNDFDNFF